MNQIKQLTKIMNCAKLRYAMNIDNNPMFWMMYHVRHEVHANIQRQEYMLQICQSGYISWR